MPKIAISYRRSDSSAIAGRIADQLAARYGQESIFLDVDSVPVGTDFRKYIQQVWSEIRVLIVVVGPKWLGADEESSAPARIHERRDVVRIELEMALKRDVVIIPVLVDGATMPLRQQLPRGLRAFSDRNAADVADGRDFHPHMERLIQAIDRATGEPSDQPNPEPGVAHVQLEPAQVGGAACGAARQQSVARLAWLLRDIAFPVFILVAVHHLIVNAFDLDLVYLRVASFVVPFLLGIFTFCHARWEPVTAFVVATAIGLVSVVAMTVSQGLNSGRSIMPSTTFEWRESVEYTVSIAFSFFAGCLLARLWRNSPPRKRA
jgi:hypothetical protein